MNENSFIQFYMYVWNVIETSYHFIFIHLFIKFIQPGCQDVLKCPLLRTHFSLGAIYKYFYVMKSTCLLLVDDAPEQKMQCAKKFRHKFHPSLEPLVEVYCGKGICLVSMLIINLLGFRWWIGDKEVKYYLYEWLSISWGMIILSCLYDITKIFYCYLIFWYLFYRVILNCVKTKRDFCEKA